MFRTGKHGGGWISLCVVSGPHRKTFDIPIQLFKKRGSLLRDLTRWLPVPIQDVENYKEQLVNDEDKWRQKQQGKRD